MFAPLAACLELPIQPHQHKLKPRAGSGAGPFKGSSRLFSYRTEGADLVLFAWIPVVCAFAKRDRIPFGSPCRRSFPRRKPRRGILDLGLLEPLPVVSHMRAPSISAIALQSCCVQPAFEFRRTFCAIWLRACSFKDQDPGVLVLAELLIGPAFGCPVRRGKLLEADYFLRRKPVDCKSLQRSCLRVLDLLRVLPHAPGP